MINTKSNYRLQSTTIKQSMLIVKKYTKLTLLRIRSMRHIAISRKKKEKKERTTERKKSLHVENYLFHIPFSFPFHTYQYVNIPNR